MEERSHEKIRQGIPQEQESPEGFEGERMREFAHPNMSGKQVHSECYKLICRMNDVEVDIKE